MVVTNEAGKVTGVEGEDRTLELFIDQVVEYFNGCEYYTVRRRAGDTHRCEDVFELIDQCCALIDETSVRTFAIHYRKASAEGESGKLVSHDTLDAKYRNQLYIAIQQHFDPHFKELLAAQE